jgi:hypothetical protein
MTKDLNEHLSLLQEHTSKTAVLVRALAHVTTFPVFGKYFVATQNATADPQISDLCFVFQ